VEHNARPPAAVNASMEKSRCEIQQMD